MTTCSQRLGVMDSTATSLSMDNIFPFWSSRWTRRTSCRAVMGEKIGTIVKEELLMKEQIKEFQSKNAENAGRALQGASPQSAQAAPTRRYSIRSPLTTTVHRRR